MLGMAAFCSLQQPVLASEEPIFWVEETFLSGTSVTSITKDQTGRMWLATNNGVILYDGFETIAVPIGKVGSIRQVWQCKKGMIFARNSTEIWTIDKQTLKAHCIFRVQNPTLSITTVCLRQSSSGFFLSLSNGDVYNMETDGTATLYLKTVMPISQMTESENGDIFFTSKNKLYHYQPLSRSLKFIRLEIRTGALNDVIYSGSKLFLGTWYAGLQTFAIPALQREQLPAIDSANQRNKRVISMTASDSMVYIAYDNYSFYLYDRFKKTLYEISKDYRDIFYGKTVNCIYEDSNIVWIGTDKGFIKIVRHRNRFHQILNDRLPIVSTRSIIKERGDLYVASYSGIYYKRGEEAWSNLSNQFTSKHVVYPQVMLNGGSRMYLGMESPTIFALHKAEKQLEEMSIPAAADTEEKTSIIYAMEFAPSGGLWAAGKGGIYFIDTIARHVKRYPENVFNVNGAIVRHLLFDKKEARLYAATNKGLFIFTEDGKLTDTLNKTNTFHLGSDNITFITIAPDKSLWVATWDSGIYVLDKTTVTAHLAEENGLCNNHVYGILFDTFNKAWISTYNGLSSYDFKSNGFYNYFTFDGLSANEFNLNSLLKSDDGLFYFGGINGVSSFNPGAVRVEMPSFNLFISGIKKWNKNGYSVTASGNAEKLIKQSDDYSLSVMLGISDYAFQQKALFYYRIEDITDGWVQIPAPGHILLPDGLPYGKYDVALKAINFRGVSSSNTVHFQLHVEAPFYYRWWFVISFFGTLSAVFYLLYRYRLNQMKKVEAVRIKISSDLHDEVGGLLTGIGLYSQTLAARADLNFQAKERANKISTLSRSAVSSMRDILWTVDARNDKIDALEDHIRAFAEEMLTAKDIIVRISFETDRLKKGLPGDMRQQLYFFAKEAITNIVKHSNATTVSIRFRQKGNNFVFNICNDGATDTTGKTNTGQGLKNMQMRAGRLNAQLTVESHAGNFTVQMQKNYPFM